MFEDVSPVDHKYASTFIVDPEYKSSTESPIQIVTLS